VVREAPNPSQPFALSNTGLQQCISLAEYKLLCYSSCVVLVTVVNSLHCIETSNCSDQIYLKFCQFCVLATSADGKVPFPVASHEFWLVVILISKHCSKWRWWRQNNNYNNNNNNNSSNSNNNNNVIIMREKHSTSSNITIDKVKQLRKNVVVRCRTVKWYVSLIILLMWYASVLELPRGQGGFPHCGCQSPTVRVPGIPEGSVFVPGTAGAPNSRSRLSKMRSRTGQTDTDIQTHRQTWPNTLSRRIRG